MKNMMIQVLVSLPSLHFISMQPLNTIYRKRSIPFEDNSPLEFTVPDETSEEDLKSPICMISETM